MDDANSSRSFERKAQRPGFLLHQSLFHFKQFNADEALPGQPHVLLWIYMYTQKQLITKYQVLQKRFRKPVTILEQTAGSKTPAISIDRSQYQEYHQAEQE